MLSSLHTANSIPSRNHFKGILTVHVDLLAQFNQLHLCWHVAHCSHAVPQVFTPDEAILVLVKLPECFT